MLSPLSDNDKNFPADSVNDRASAYPLLLSAIYLIFWLMLAIAPLDRGDWAVENVLPLLAMPLLIYVYRRHLVSNFSYTLVFVFLMLHAIGAHYTYAKVPYEQWTRPLGFSIDDLLGLQRNGFDRLVHFLYGLLLFPIFWELFAKRVDAVAPSAAASSVLVDNALRYLLVGGFLMAHAGIYEIIEWLAAAVVGGDLGAAYLGTQGDEWDAQKDMALAYLGTLLAISIDIVWRRAQARRYAAGTTR